MGRFFDIALVFAATVFGIFTYYATAECTITWLLCAVVIIGFGCRWYAEHRLLKPEPTRATLIAAVPLVYASVAVNFALIALVSWFTLLLTLWLTGQLSAGGVLEVPEDDAATVSKLVIGAVTGFLGSAFYEEAKNPQSTLWPPQVFKRLISRTFAGHPHISGNDTPELYDLLYYDDTRQGISGWRVVAALRRADRIGRAYRNVPSRSG